MSTIEKPVARTSDGSGTKPLVRHLVQRGNTNNYGDRPLEPAQPVTLCGLPWDRLNVTSGEMCKQCVMIFRFRHPGWPLPG